LHDRLMAARSDPDAISIRPSRTVVDLAPHLEDFIGSCSGSWRDTGIAGAPPRARSLYSANASLFSAATVKWSRKAEAAELDGPASPASSTG